MKLPPYRPDAKCPKCGHTEVTTVYFAANDGYHYPHSPGYPAERLLRTCTRCMYNWAEAPLTGEQT